jgi:hypothetical protein
MGHVVAWSIDRRQGHLVGAVHVLDGCGTAKQRGKCKQQDEHGKLHRDKGGHKAHGDLHDGESEGGRGISIVMAYAVIDCDELGVSTCSKRSGC